MTPLERLLDASRTVRRRWAAATAVGLLCGLLAAVPDAGAQAVRGLVVGIDDYAHITRLQGAVNDARDIGKALEELGVDDLTILLDGDATRARFAAEWRRLLDRAASGDTLVLAYAGHGWQEPERVAGTERDGKDEALLLGGFSATGNGTRERIVDDELHQWFLDAGRRELKVVFVADACHSGTLTRTVDPRVRLSYRYTPYTEMAGDALALDLPEEAATVKVGEGRLTHVTMLAAAQEHQKVPEIKLGGEMRGALSYAFAQALRGKADVDGDGALGREELWRFVHENVRMHSESRQDPNVVPNNRPNEIVLRLAPPSPNPTGTGGAPAPAGPEAVRLAVLPAGPDTLAAVREKLPEVRLVPDGPPADLVWDVDTRQVVTGLGDVAAHDVDLDALPGVVGKWEAVAAVRALSARASLRLRINPHDRVHRHGCEAEVRVEGLSHPRLTVFSLSGNGQVHYLYPGPDDNPAGLAVGRPFEFRVEVGEPYGADHVVAVSAGSALDGLNASLRSLNGKVAADRAAALLSAAKAGAADWSSGVQGLYTAPGNGAGSGCSSPD